MWYAYYEAATGKLRSQGQALNEHLPEGIACKEYADRPANLWDETTADFTVPFKKCEAITPDAFMMRFTTEERIAIRTAAKTDPLVEDVFDLVHVTPEIRSNMQGVVGGMALLVSKGLLTQERADEIGDF